MNGTEKRSLHSNCSLSLQLLFCVSICRALNRFFIISDSNASFSLRPINSALDFRELSFRNKNTLTIKGDYITENGCVDDVFK